MYKSIRVFAALATFIGSVQCASGVADRSANLLENPDFENGLLGWSQSFPDRVDWVLDYTFPPPGDTGIGAGALFAKGILGQCVPVNASNRYAFSVWALSQCKEEALTINITWYSDSCVSAGDSTSIVMQVKADQWQQTAGFVDSPDYAQSASFNLLQLGCSQASLVDEVVFSDQIFANSFEQ